MTKLVGITGGVGCGKTTVLEILKEITNCRVLLTDEIARDLMKKEARPILPSLIFLAKTTWICPVKSTESSFQRQFLQKRTREWS